MVSLLLMLDEDAQGVDKLTIDVSQEEIEILGKAIQSIEDPDYCTIIKGSFYKEPFHEHLFDAFAFVLICENRMVINRLLKQRFHGVCSP
jgi:hypothetical protein